MIQILKAIFLGVVQGLTEFLPVSSTGHLIILENIFGLSQEKFGLGFDAACHLGTAAAVFVYFWDEWKKILQSLFTSEVEASSNKKDFIGSKKFKNQLMTLFFSPRRWNSLADKKLAWSLLLATIPAAVIGFFLENTIETTFRQPRLVAFALLFGSLIIFSAEKIGKKLKSLKEFDKLSATIIGFAQSIALVPGISRSGITISTGMFLGLKRKSAAEFAFLLSGPIILGAGGKKLIDVVQAFLKGGMNISDLSFFVVGMIASAIAGFWAIKFLMEWLAKKSMNIFVVYRLILAVGVLLLSK